jgi:hypothetical protein
MSDPWVIVGWIGAVCTAVVIIMLTISVVAALLRNLRKPPVPPPPMFPPRAPDNFTPWDGSGRG